MKEQPQLFDSSIFCALHEEASAVIEEFETRCGVSFTQAFRKRNQLEYRHATIRNQRGESLTICVTWPSDMGPIRTALDIKSLLQEINPRFVAMTGLCAGDRRKVKLGDLIVATAAYHPEAGKILTGTDEQLVRLPETRMAGASTQVIQYVQGFSAWRQPVHELKRQMLNAADEPHCHIGVMASTMAVRSDNPFPALTARYHRKTVGVDMEAAAFYTALHDFPLIHGLVVKGVSDYGDSSKNDEYHNYATHASAVYLLHFIQEYVTEETMPRQDAPDQARPSGIWNVPYLRNPHFTGRDELLDRLDQQLSSETPNDPTLTHRVALTQPQAIRGLGGIGKTQIAVEYAYRSREQTRYTHTLWINAASEEAVMASFVTLAQLLPAFPAKGETDQSKLVAAIKRWLEQCQERWLLIFDNADDVSLIQTYLPQRGNGSVLLTTRANAVGALATPIPVEIMSFVEGTHLLLRRAQRFHQASEEEVNEAGNIVIALDSFPLALDQAGAYIEETKCSLVDYLHLYQTHRKELLAQRGSQVTNYPDAVATTWLLSFQKVERANPAAAELLHLCAYLAPDQIPEELIQDGAAQWSPLLRQAATDPFRFNQVITELLKFSLVERLTATRTLRIHRLVQAVQKDAMEQEVQHQWAERVVRAVNQVFPQDSQEPATWPQCLRYLDQAQASQRLIEDYMFLAVEAADLLNRTGLYLDYHALYTTAELLYQRALAIREQVLGTDHPDTATILNNLAILYKQQGHYHKAELLHQRALAIREQKLGATHTETARSLNNLGGLYYEQGKYTQAEPLLVRALAIREQQLGTMHADTAHSLHELATFRWRQGKFGEAESLYHCAHVA